MNIFGEIALFSWPVLSILFFNYFKPHHAAMMCIVGGWLFLPVGLPPILGKIHGLPEYSKYTAISAGLIFGVIFSGSFQKVSFKLKFYDWPMIIFVFCPIPTSLSNNLGLYDGLAGSYIQIMAYGIPYLAGRMFFNSQERLRELCLAIMIGGSIYAILCLFELRMSPLLHREIYGTFPHASFKQHMRAGGYRPIVFMEHGLMVATWMAVNSIIAFWFWWGSVIKKLKGIPIYILFGLFSMTTLLCKSVNGIGEMLIGCGAYLVFRIRGISIPHRILILTIPVYILVRLTNFIPSEDIGPAISRFIEHERIVSLNARLYQEDQFKDKLFKHPVFGWGGYGRSRPIDPRTGELMRTVDSLWLIVASTYGFTALLGFLGMMLLGPWKILHRRAKEANQQCFEAVVLSIVVALFTIDCCFNGMFNQIYMLIAGSILCYYSSMMDQKYVSK